MIKGIAGSIKKAVKNIYTFYAPFYTKAFYDTYNFLQDSQWWSKEKLEEYQLEQLSRLLHHAYENVPYYRRVFDERGLKPKDIHNIADLQQLPYLTKDDFKKYFMDLVAKNIDAKDFVTCKTSGTSGKCLHFYRDASIMQKELAFIYHQWLRIGYKLNSKRAVIGGAVIDDGDPVWLEGNSKILKLSPRIDNTKIAQYYLSRIKDFKADFLHGYPSAIAALVHIIRKHSLPVPFQLKAVLFASEAVYDWERAIASDVFGCRVFSHYGMGEQVVLAAECEESPYYHCMPQYGVTEIDPQTNEIIGTGFFNYINPFIRYRTTDIASGFTCGCAYCGRQYYPVFEKVEGRIGDYIATSRGMVGPAAVTHPFKNLSYIKDSQIIQKAIDLIVLRIVPWDKEDSVACQKEAERLSRDLQKILGSDMRIEIQKIDAIQRMPSGKFKWITSDISKDMLERGLRETE